MFQITRRGFLATAGAAVRLRAASDTPGVLSIGVGSRGSGIAIEAAGLGRLVAVCDVDSAQSDLFLEKLAKKQTAKPELYKDYRKALERKDVDVVTIGTPDHWHTAVLLAALRAGKDVYCEKPMTLTIDEGKKIVKAVRESGRVVQVGTQQRSEFKQNFLKAAALVRAGRLGKKLTATCMIGEGSKGGPYPVMEAPSTLDWNFWLGQAPVAPYTTKRCHRTFRWWLEYSGGKLTDWGAHHIDSAQWAMGEENTGPVEIEAVGEMPLGREATLAHLLGKGKAAEFPNAYNTATTFRVTMKYASGSTLIVTEGPGNGIQIDGDKSSLFVSRSQLTGPAVEAVAASEKEQEWLAAEVVRLYRGKQPTTHMQDFFDCMKTRRQPISDVYTHHRSMSSCHLANIALLAGRKLKWNPEREIFQGDAEANLLLSRPQRKGFEIS